MFLPSGWLPFHVTKGPQWDPGLVGGGEVRDGTLREEDQKVCCPQIWGDKKGDKLGGKFQISLFYGYCSKDLGRSRLGFRDPSVRPNSLQ